MLNVNANLSPKSKIDSVELWNLRCGKTNDLTGEDLYDALANQCERLDEEFLETVNAMQAKDQVEILDGIVDIDVVLAGLCMIGGFLNEDDLKSKMAMVDVTTIQNSNHDDVTPDLYWDLMYHYTNLIGETLVELKRAVDNQEPLDVIGGHAMTMYAMLTVLERFSDHDVDGAFNVIMENNDAKWLTDMDDAGLLAAEIINNTGEDHSVFESVVLGVTTYSIHRDWDDKIVKFPNHPKVDITGFISTLPKTLK